MKTVFCMDEVALVRADRARGDRIRRVYFRCDLVPGNLCVTFAPIPGPRSSELEPGTPREP
jgi:hypothetical protein